MFTRCHGRDRQPTIEAHIETAEQMSLRLKARKNLHLAKKSDKSNALKMEPCRAAQELAQDGNRQLQPPLWGNPTPKSLAREISDAIKKVCLFTASVNAPAVVSNEKGGQGKFVPFGGRQQERNNPTRGTLADEIG